MPGLITEQPPASKARKPTKNEQRRAKKKQQKLEATPAPEEPAVDSSAISADHPDANHPVKPVQPAAADPVQDVLDIESFDLPADDPLLTQFKGVFAKFQEEEEEVKAPEKPDVFFGDEDDNIQGEDEEEETQKKLSKKAIKQSKKLSIAELKAIVRKPETVEWNDTTANDPKLLVNLKGTRNVVPVPAHWSLKREYLSSKRGIEKTAWALPKFIAETGISEMRDAALDKQAEASMKSKQRDRVQPKMGKLDIDYQKLYEAFFRRQTKPELTKYGEVYYEGKEYETNLRHLKPGELSDELKEALGMTPGGPPPWLINMQKVGPPPAYPSLKIPGLTAPPPPGQAWGFQPGGYGKPPVNEDGTSMWGDITGGDASKDAELEKQKEADRAREAEADRTLWGELGPVEEEEEEEDEDEDESEKDGQEEGDGTETPFDGVETPGGIYSTVPTDFGIQSMTEEFNLRKRRRGTETEESHAPRSAGTVLQERNIRAEGFFGGERAYDLNNQRGGTNAPMLGERDERGKKRKVGDMDISVDVDALERDDKLSKDEVKRQYEAQRQQGQGGGGWQGGAVDQDDLSQMIAEESAKRMKKDREREKGGGRRR